jgi:glycosyltransferase involved in cell wall biosynthesis
VDTFGLQQSVEFHGWLDRERLIGLLKKAHFVALPSRTEGWPKILSEGMAFGAIPLSSNVSGIPKFLSKVRAGWCSRPDDFAGMARAIRQYVENPESWREESLRCVDAAVQFSYQAYLEGVSEMMDLPAHEAGTV